MEWKWCLVDGNTNNLLTGWKEVEGKWYYLNLNGTMLTGWLQHKNKWYYLNSNGVMSCDCVQTIDDKEYKFDSNGALIESFVSDECIDFIKSWEGFSATPYYDEVGVLTLGYGMTGEEIQGITEVAEGQATTMLKDWINNKYAPVIKSDLDSRGITLKQNEFDALVSFAYNCGTGGLLNSTLYRRICEGIRDNSLINNFQAWSNGGGRRIEGLFRRRTKEAAIFLNGDYTGNV
ncbi:lysozyme RrrD [Clostridium puniceum]|uniref:Lysozyme n=1 Tax=Clostridium puniceum TaxID=29367 RepID=A0A1S8SY38_9CLOT|nr:lysozyme [Clostridium puniceum]OOM70291.1 lysozyme RrrD [Clostridium puniceum]